MNAKDIALVKTTWASVQVGERDLADVFYSHLFTREPSLRDMFPLDLGAQSTKLANTFALLVDVLDTPEALAARLWTLGRMHVDLGVREAHYALMERVLLDALEDCLERELTSAERAAWQQAYAYAVGEMTAADIDAPW